MTVSEFAQLLTALAVMGNCLISWRNSRKIDRTNESVASSKADIKELAQNTNSIKDALVASTAKASHAEGLAEGREQVSKS